MMVLSQGVFWCAIKSVCALLFYACLDTCCSHFLTIITGVDLHFRHEPELPVCRTQELNPGHRGFLTLYRLTQSLDIEFGA